MEDNKKLIFAIRDKKLGIGEVLFCWQPGCLILAYCGENKVISVIDRLGNKVIDFPLKQNGKCKYIEFDSEGDTLCCLQEKASKVTTFNIYTKKVLELEINKNNNDYPTCIRWAKNLPILAIGTTKGLIYFFNKKSGKLTQISIGHSNEIVSACWNNNGILASGDAGKSLSITNKNGESILQNAKTKEKPEMINWAKRKTNDNSLYDTTISTVQNSKTLLIYDLNKKIKPIELSLDPDYGKIVAYSWFLDGYIAIGFSGGYLSIVSTHEVEVRNEIHSNKVFKASFDDLSVCEAANRIAVAGENEIKIFDLTSFKEYPDEKITISKVAGRIYQIKWSDSGQILLVSTTHGSLMAFNVIISDKFGISGNLFSTLLSLNDICTYEMTKDNEKKKLYSIKLPEEPLNFVVCNSYFLASFGTKAMIYKTRDDKGKIITDIVGKEKDFFANISMISINEEYVSIVADGKCNFIKLSTEKVEKVFPLKDLEDRIIFVSMTEDFLVYSDDQNKVKVFSIKKGCANIGEYKFENCIRKIFPNKKGTKYLCLDDLGNGFLYTPSNESVIAIGNKEELALIIWDQDDPNLFIGANKTYTKVRTFVIIHNSLHGPFIRTIKELSSIEDIEKDQRKSNITDLPDYSYPFYLSNGELSYFCKNTKEIKSTLLSSHYWHFNYRDGNDDDEVKKYFMENLQLAKYNECFKLLSHLEEKDKIDYANALGKETLNNLEIDIAKEAFRIAEDISLVLTIEQLKKENEKKIILANIAAILGDEDLAEELYKESSQPEKALELRVDLQDWSIALKLAKDYNPTQVPFISRKLAYQYEVQKNIQEALNLYEQSLIHNIQEFLNKTTDYDSNDIEKHNEICTSGLSRCFFKLGDTNKGLVYADQIKDKNLIIEIANLCENLTYDLDAAKLYTKVELYEKAASIFIRLKLFKYAEDLIDKIKSPKLLIQLAKMKESEKMYPEAEKAYEAAKDWENVIRINLQYLNNHEKARQILMDYCKTESAAIMMAEYFEKIGKKKQTIEYLLIAKRYEEAFTNAQTYNEMEVYATYMLKNCKNIDEFKKIATYYEGKGDYGNSGIFYEKIGDFPNALKMYILSKNDKYLEAAVEMVGQVKDEQLVNKLIDYFLLGEQSAKGHHFLTRLYILLGDYKQACDIAITLANDEQKYSNYKKAHQILADLFIGLKEKDLPVSYELNHRLSVLHSYLLAKKLIKKRMILSAAQNLLRVANNITMFASDKVKILTTVVIECHEAGLLKTSSEIAIDLIKDYSDQIPEKYKPKIEKISVKAYKAEKNDDIANSSTPCPFCKKELPEYTLECKNCQNIVPFCIASGKHISLNDLTMCPHCHFPAILSDLKDLINDEVACPMCEGEIDARLMDKVDDVKEYIKSRKIATSNTVDKKSQKFPEDEV